MTNLYTPEPVTVSSYPVYTRIMHDRLVENWNSKARLMKTMLTGGVPNHGLTCYDMLPTLVEMVWLYQRISAHEEVLQHLFDMEFLNEKAADPQGS